MAARLRRWAEKDSNLRRRLPTDLQSVPVVHLGIRPLFNFISHPTIGQQQLMEEDHTRADDGNRTHNLPLTRRLLYRLSYVGKQHFLALSRAIIPKHPIQSKEIKALPLNQTASDFIRIPGERQEKMTSSDKTAIAIMNPRSYNGL